MASVESGGSAVEVSAAAPSEVPPAVVSCESKSADGLDTTLTALQIAEAAMREWIPFHTESYARKGAHPNLKAVIGPMHTLGFTTFRYMEGMGADNIPRSRHGFAAAAGQLLFCEHALCRDEHMRRNRLKLVAYCMDQTRIGTVKEAMEDYITKKREIDDMYAADCESARAQHKAQCDEIRKAHAEKVEELRKKYYGKSGGKGKKRKKKKKGKGKKEKKGKKGRDKKGGKGKKGKGKKGKSGGDEEEDNDSGFDAAIEKKIREEAGELLLPELQLPPPPAYPPMPVGEKLAAASASWGAVAIQYITCLICARRQNDRDHSKRHFAAAFDAIHVLFMSWEDFANARVQGFMLAALREILKSKVLTLFTFSRFLWKFVELDSSIKVAQLNLSSPTTTSSKPAAVQRYTKFMAANGFFQTVVPELKENVPVQYLDTGLVDFYCKFEGQFADEWTQDSSWRIRPEMCVAAANRILSVPWKAETDACRKQALEVLEIVTLQMPRRDKVSELLRDVAATAVHSQKAFNSLSRTALLCLTGVSGDYTRSQHPFCKQYVRDNGFANDVKEWHTFRSNPEAFRRTAYHFRSRRKRRALEVTREYRRLLTDDAFRRKRFEEREQREMKFASDMKEFMQEVAVPWAAELGFPVPAAAEYSGESEAKVMDTADIEAKQSAELPSARRSSMEVPPGLSQKEQALLDKRLQSIATFLDANTHDTF